CGRLLPSDAGGAPRRSPQVAGVPHGVIRLAVGRWARAAVATWHARHAREALLLGETPFVGHRLVELARTDPHDAEPLLASASARFVVPGPSPALTGHS